MGVTVTNVNKFDRQSFGGGNGDGAYDVAASSGDDGTKEPWQRIALNLMDVVLLKVLDYACSRLLILFKNGSVVNQLSQSRYSASMP